MINSYYSKKTTASAMSYTKTCPRKGVWTPTISEVRTKNRLSASPTTLPTIHSMSGIEKKTYFRNIFKQTDTKDNYIMNRIFKQ